MTFQRDLAWQHLEATYRASIAHQFARYALALNYELLPPQVVQQAKRCVLDALGCAIGGHQAPGLSICEDAIKKIGGTPEATVFGSGFRTNTLNATLINSFLVRFLDFNDIGCGGHGSDALASILAVAEAEKASGRDFLTALVISYELGARFRSSLSSPNAMEDIGWTSDDRAGLIQPPAIGKLMGLDETQIANAIGICASHTLPLGILDTDREENVMAKNLRFGWVAHDAIIACILAKGGFTGPVRVVESETAGIRKVIAAGDMDLERMINFSGWQILDVRFKAVAANATTHGHIFATLGIVKEHNLTPEDIAAVNIRASLREVKHTTTPAKKYPRHAESADHSAHYAQAVVIKERAFRADSIVPGKFTDPVILDLIEKTTITVDPRLEGFQAVSEIVTKDGRRYENRVDLPHGRGEDALTNKELEDKFTEMAVKHMPHAQIKKIFEMCWGLEDIKDVGELVKLMVFPKSG